MRGVTRIVAAAGVAMAAAAVLQASPASAAPRIDDCSTSTNGETYASGTCLPSHEGPYQIAATYCRPPAGCQDDVGGWTSRGGTSELDYPSGGTISNVHLNF